MKKSYYKLILLSSLFSVLLLVRCKKEGLENVEPKIEIKYKTEAEFKKGIEHLYGGFSVFYTYRNFIYGSTYLLGDDITTNDLIDMTENFKDIHPSSGKMEEFWKISMKIDSNANKLLYAINKAEDASFSSSTVKAKNKGEILFARGYINYILYNYYATAPLITETNVYMDKNDIVNSKNTELLDQSIKDFELAASLLPTSSSNTDTIRITKNSAFGMLGKSLVIRASINKNTSDYSNALIAFSKIVGTNLNSNFYDNFSEEKEFNNESIFELNSYSERPLGSVWLPYDFDDELDVNVYYGMYRGDWTLFGTSRYYATDKLYNAFENGDPRKMETLVPESKFIVKYVKNQTKPENASFDYNNPRILRLADVKLLEAEAILQSGGSTSEAINKINEVRTRARGNGSIPANYSTSETNKNTIMNWIMNERLIELAGEGQRWIDIRRWHMQGIITLNNEFFSSKVTVDFQSPKNLNFPFPTSQLEAYPNLKQNLGY